MALATLSLVFAMIASGSTAMAQDGELTPVCIEAFESAPNVEYLTDEQIAELEATEDDGSDIPPPRIVGYPDPETGSCATENGELKEYDPDVYTPICLPSGPEGDGPLVVQWAYTHYVVPEADLILADPVTGACPGDDGASTGDDGSSTGDDDAASGDSSETSTLPRTGAGETAADASEQTAPIALLLMATTLFGAGIVARRQRSA